MVPNGLIYSFVAKGTVVLAEHTPYSGNFSTIAVQCLQKLPSNSSKYTYSCDGHTFNFLLDSGFGICVFICMFSLCTLLLKLHSSVFCFGAVFLVVADESMGRSIPFVFLERVKDDFKQRYGASIKSDDPHPLADDEDEDDLLFEDRFSIAYNLDREFGCVYAFCSILGTCIKTSMFNYPNIILELISFLFSLPDLSSRSTCNIV